MRLIIFLAIFSLSISMVRAQDAAVKTEDSVDGPSLSTDEEKTSYALGTQIGASFKRDEISLKPDQFLAGVRDSFEGNDLKLPQDEVMAMMQALQMKLQAKAMADQESAEEESAELGPKNKAAGEAFLAENGKKDGVKTTESGLQYEVLTEGTGEKPTAADTVKVHYHGTLIDGTVFDSSVERGTPATFPLGGVIRGWTEGLQLMPVGSKYRLFVPYDLAYGEQARSGEIGPYSALVFDVELLEIVEGNN
jgi:FKBP-type peptidyl-prolyl cis-trans isomerase FklB